MILDIRKEQKEEVTGIKFDDSKDCLQWGNDYLYLTDSYNEKKLVQWNDFDNFIAALYKAKELAGK